MVFRQVILFRKNSVTLYMKYNNVELLEFFWIIKLLSND